MRPPSIRPRVVCLLCRNRVSRPHPRVAFSTTAPRRQPLSLTERLRRRIWGTDNPPGQTDPYAVLTPEEREKDLARRAERAREEEKAPEPSNVYLPATTWDGLETIGGFDGVDWDAEHPFHGFMTDANLTTPAQLTAALHRAIVEVHTLRQPGPGLARVSKIPLHEDSTGDVQITPSNNARKVKLVYPSEEVREAILRSASGRHESPEPETETTMEEVVAPLETLDVETSVEATTFTEEEIKAALSPQPEEQEQELVQEQEDTQLAEDDESENQLLEAQISSWNPGWLEIPLTNQSVKFAVMKRVTQLTGRRIPDPVISRAENVRALHDFLMTPPKPKKVAELLMDNEQLTSLPNLKIFPRRVTPIHRDLALGRWKVVERELLEKGLPVVGRG